MTSENLPPQSNSHDAQPADGGGQPADGSGAQAPAAQPYPQASVNTGEYRRSVQEPTGSPSREAEAHAADTGPVHQVPADDATARPAVWQPRPSGALAAEAWSSAASAASYPATGSSYPGSDQGGNEYGATQHGAAGAGQYGTAGPTQYGAAGAGQYGAATPTQYGTGHYPSAGYGGYRSDQRSDAYPTAYYAPAGQQTGYGDYRQQPGAGATGSGPATATKPRTRNRVLIGATAAVLMLGASFGAGALGAETRTNSVADSSLSQQSTAPVVADTQPVAAGSVESVAAKLLPSVVSILSISSTEEAEGSGIILTSDGNILTNNHVIAGATDLTVKFNDGTTAKAKVVGSDATDDLAVIKVSGVSNLTVATLGVSANVKVGQQVVAVGSPLGLSATVTSGIVSALNRPVRTAAEGSGQNQDPSQDPTQGSSTATAQDTVLNAIQTDAAINPGNSGGALVNMSGAVIGINSAIASLSSGSSSTQSGSIGVGFAIPIDQAHRIAQEIISTGHATHALLGASVGDAPVATVADPTQAAQAGLSAGAKIASVTSGGGAAGAGLAAGDVITKIGSAQVDSADALIATIRSATPGSKVTVTYVRGSDTKTATVTLGSAVSK